MITFQPATHLAHLRTTRQAVFDVLDAGIPIGVVSCVLPLPPVDPDLPRADRDLLNAAAAEDQTVTAPWNAFRHAEAEALGGPYPDRASAANALVNRS